MTACRQWRALCGALVVDAVCLSWVVLAAWLAARPWDAAPLLLHGPHAVMTLCLGPWTWALPTARVPAEGVRTAAGLAFLGDGAAVTWHVVGISEHAHHGCITGAILASLTAASALHVYWRAAVHLQHVLAVPPWWTFGSTKTAMPASPTTWPLGRTAAI